MDVVMHINLNGNCREAIKFYAQVFDTKVPQLLTFGDAPPNPAFRLPEEAKDLILYSRLNLNGTEVVFADVMPETKSYNESIKNNFSLTIVSHDLEEIKFYFNKLKEDGTVRMELQETFWSKCYGNLTDKFGVDWQFNLEPSEM